MHDSYVPVLTIDGPSGTGKGTVARVVADVFSWHILDSGALYRVLALFAMKNSCSLKDVDGIAKLALCLPLEFHGTQVLLHNVDVSKEIRSESCGAWASQIAVFPAVRQALLARQHAFAKLPGLIADGRDMGTVVFPEAFLKIYLDASVDERAKRRFLQLKGQGHDVKMPDLVADIRQRDERDKSRAVAPLEPASDALIIDSSDMTISEVSQLVIEEARQRL